MRSLAAAHQPARSRITARSGSAHAARGLTPRAPARALTRARGGHARTPRRRPPPADPAPHAPHTLHEVVHVAADLGAPVAAHPVLRALHVGVSLLAGVLALLLALALGRRDLLVLDRVRRLVQLREVVRRQRGRHAADELLQEGEIEDRLLARRRAARDRTLRHRLGKSRVVRFRRQRQRREHLLQRRLLLRLLPGARGRAR
mmetsp:Transcript_1529/g.4844  ORF Transcript_1529/g.4844 Transcript_1529/m.4844 type:complete len:203 (+) Transcript_1529:169-777(+)